MISLSRAGIAVLGNGDVAEKCRLTRQAADDWAAGRLSMPDGGAVPARPARPALPRLLPPKDMPKRAYGGERGKIGLLHALAHIELNAIDLAWDLIARFADANTPRTFLDAWVQVALDEVIHFEMLQDLLARLGAKYGDLPAHDGLWQAAEKTAGDLMGRLAVVPMTLEARGLDTTPQTMERLARNGDTTTPAALQVIYQDEITHVAAGLDWFKHLARQRGLDGKAEYARLLGVYFPGGLKAPFNHAARSSAGFARDWYESLGSVR